MPPKPKLEFVEVPAPPPPPALSPQEAEAFKYSDEAAKFCGTERLQPIRTATGLVGFHYNPFGTPPPEYAAFMKHIAETWIIVYRDGKSSKFPLVPKHDFKELVASPSGRRFLVFSKNGPAPNDPNADVTGGHAVEVEVETLQATVALTGTTGRSGAVSSYNLDARTVWGLDYLDEDTLVGVISEKNATIHSLLLLARGADGAFVEIDRIDAPKDGFFPKTGGGVIAISTKNKLAMFGVVDQKLVKLGSIDKPAKYGPVVAHPVATREELLFVDKESSKHYRLTNQRELLAATKPKKKG